MLDIIKRNSRKGWVGHFFYGGRGGGPTRGGLIVRGGLFPRGRYDQEYITLKKLRAK